MKLGLRRNWAIGCLGSTVLVVLAAVALAYASWPADSVEAVLRVAKQQEETEDDYRRFKQTVVRLASSPFVMNAAIRDDRVASLQVLQNRLRPGYWLSQRIEVESDEDSGILHLRLPVPSHRELDDLRSILDRITDTLVDELAGGERLERLDQLANFRKRFRELFDTVQVKASELADLKDRNGTAGVGAFKRQRLEAQIVQSEQSLMELEISQLQGRAASEAGRARVQARKEQLRSQREALTQELAVYGNLTGDIVVRRCELKALKDELRRIRRRITDLEIELERPPRLSVIQAAVSVREEKLLESGF